MRTLRIDQLEPAEVGESADFIRGLGRSAPSVEAAAQRTALHLYETLVDEEGERGCPLVRVYKTHAYDALPPELQAFARDLLGREPAGDVRCLTLLGTAGDEPAWNDRRLSEAHKAIPLPNTDFVDRLPMVARLITQLGLDIEAVVRPPSRSAPLAQQTYDVFHVPDAVGSPFLPAQDFVREHRIRSAVGFGGILISGDFYATVAFSKVAISEPVARTLKILALPLRVALTPVIGRPVFDD